MTEKEGVKVTRVNIREEVGARIMGKPVGNYITIEANGLKQRDKDVYEETSRALGEN